MATKNSGEIPDNDPTKMSKKDRREHMREAARVRREAEQKRKKRNRFIAQASVVVAALAVIALVVVLISNNRAEASKPGPLNMASDGVLLTAGPGDSGEIVTVETPATPAGGTPIASTPDPAKKNIVVYLDYMCPFCGQFEDATIAGLKELVGSGEATLEIHPMGLLDRFSSGTRFSSRAASAMSCVANYEPNSFLDASAALFANQPQENTSGLKNSEMAKIFTDAGITSEQVASCVTGGEFMGFVDNLNKRALEGPLPNTSVERVTGTPLVLVNGVQWTPTTSWADSTAFFSFVAAQN